MSKYKVEYIHTSSDHKKWYKVKKEVDGWTLGKELEALLAEYETKGYEVLTIEAINTTTEMGKTKTDGILVVFRKTN